MATYQKQVEKELFDRESRLVIPKTENQDRVELDEGITIKGQKIPDPKLHQTISFIKSGIRIFACIAGFCSFYAIGFFGLLIAELVGIYEELV